MKVEGEDIVLSDGSLGHGAENEIEKIQALYPNHIVHVHMIQVGSAHITIYPKEEKEYEVGDMVLVPRGQKTRFFEVLRVAEDEITVTDGYIQTTKKPDELELICKAADRKDARVPYMKYWNDEKGTCE